MHIQDDIKQTVSSIGNKLHSLGFWIIIILMVGFYFGLTYANNRMNDKMGESIELKGMIYNGQVYDIQKRVSQ